MSRDAVEVRRGARWFWCLALLVVAGGVLVWFAPVIIARTSLKQQLVDRVLAPADARAQIGSASLAWTSPVIVEDLIVLDADGSVIAQVPQLRSEKTLLELARQLRKTRPSLGVFHVEQPQVNVVLREGSSNIETALQPFAKPDVSAESTATVVPDFELLVENGTVFAEDENTGGRWTIDHLNVRIAPGEPAQLVEAAGRLSSGTSSGTFEIRAELPAGDAQPDGQLVFHTSQLPLDFVGVLARRVLDQLSVTGNLTSDVSLTWRQDESLAIQSITGSATVGGLQLAAPDLIGIDRLELSQLMIQGDVRTEGQNLTARNAAIRCDVGTLQMDGELPATASGLAALSTWRDAQLRVTGDVDLAKVAALLPNTLRVREDVQITSGQIQLEYASGRVEGEQRWEGRVQTTRLTAIRAGQQIAWDRPVTVLVVAHQDAQGPVIDQLRCESDFLQATGTGTLQQGQLQAQCDLTRLADELTRFVDLQGLQLAGNATASLRWQPAEQGQTEINSQFVTEQFQLSTAGRVPWVEPHLEIKASALIRIVDQDLRDVPRGVATVVAGDDRLQVTLVEPITDIRSASRWPVHAELQGELARWLRRASPWYALDGWDVSGAATFTGQALISADTTQIQQSRLVVQNLRARNGSLFIDEELVRIEAVGSYAAAEGRLTSSVTTVATTSASLRANNIAITLHEQGPPSGSGQLAYRADVARIMRWITPPDSEGTISLAGQLTGDANLSQEGDATTIDWDAVVDQLQVLSRETSPSAGAQPVATAGPWQTVWDEREMRLAGRATYQREQDELTIDDLAMKSKLIAMSAAGRISDLSAEPDQPTPPARYADLSGEITYDMANVVQALRGYVGDGLQVQGAGSKAFLFQGPLGAAPDQVAVASPTGDASGTAWQVPAAWTAQAGVGWDRAQVYGFDVGSADLEAQLREGVVAFNPLDIQLSEGRLSCSPRLHLREPQPLLVVDQGRLIESIRITPEMCDTWLKYVAPLLADATRIDGSLSVDLTHAHVPLNAPATGDIAGTVLVHSAQVRPGPVAAPFVSIADQLRSLLRKQPLAALNDSTHTSALMTIQDGQVPFRMVQGRVYHENFQVAIGDVIIRTRGSVGQDQTLDMVADIPIQEKWLDGDVAQAMRGQTLQVPIRGTLQQPDVDKRVFEQLARQLLSAPAQQVIQDQIFRGLNKLFE